MAGGTSQSSSDYYQEWYKKNRKKLSARRKRKYAEDPDYAETQRRRVRAGWTAKEGERIEAKLSRLQDRIRKNKKKVKRQVSSRVVVGEDGSPVEVWSIGALSSRIGISPDTIRRRWEDAGIIPEATFIDDEGRRWYSKEYLEFMEKAMVDIWIHCRSLEQFSLEIHAAWEDRDA